MAGLILREVVAELRGSYVVTKDQLYVNSVNVLD
jgi:hypothetical protein